MERLLLKFVEYLFFESLFVFLGKLFWRTQFPEFYNYWSSKNFLCYYLFRIFGLLYFLKQQVFSPVVHFQQAFRKLYLWWTSFLTKFATLLNTSSIADVYCQHFLLFSCWRAEKYFQIFLLFIRFYMKLFPETVVSFLDHGSLNFPLRPSFPLLSYDLKTAWM